MGLLDVLITYLAIGSAFAMRSYFRNRRRTALTRFRAVLLELLFWFPLLLLGFLRQLSGRARGTAGFGFTRSSEHKELIEELISYASSFADKRALGELLEQYAALQFSLSKGLPPRGSEFELFAISGNRNSVPGTRCLSRRNLKKLSDHIDRTANSLIDYVDLTFNRDSTAAEPKEKLAAIFEAFEDRSSIAKLFGSKRSSAECSPVKQSYRGNTFPVSSRVAE